ncbi:MAG: hypothetical protein SGILL_010072, partial [Bacillariaceae sp.]
MACGHWTGDAAARDEISCSLGSKKFNTSAIYDAAVNYLFGLSPPGNVSTAGACLNRNTGFESFLHFHRSLVTSLAMHLKGPDCYRTYEMYFLGIIPVVLYREEHAELFRGLPLLQLPSWNLTQTELVGRMRDYIHSSEFQEATFDGWERLFLKYWRRRVLKDTNRLKEI